MIGPRKEAQVIDKWTLPKDPGLQIGQAWAASAFCREGKASVKTERRKTRALVLGRRGSAFPGRSVLKVNISHPMKAEDSGL